MKTPLVTIIIINWNGEKYLEKCLKSLTAQTYKNIDILVYDNHSSDNSVHMMQKMYPDVTVISGKKNVGFAESNNTAFQNARGEYVLLLNNDTQVSNDFLHPLVAYLVKHKSTGVVQPLLLYKGNPLYSDGSVNSAGSFITPTGFLYYPQYGKAPKKGLKAHTIFAANGACMLVRRKLVEKIGLFDPTFFAYMEETDFCHRVWNSGYHVVFEPRSVVYHKGSATSEVLDDTLKLFHAYKNRIQSLVKNLQMKWLMVMIVIQVAVLPALALFYMITARMNEASAILRALAWNVTHMSAMWKRRLELVKGRVVSDDTVFAHVMKYPRLSYYYHLLTGLERYEE